MATTTPNYGWPVPTSTDFVKDGAQAIEDLGDAIDATVFGLPSAALSLVSATTIGTTVSSVAVTSAFSTTYDAYKIVISGGVASTPVDINFALTGSTANYAYSYQLLSYAGVLDNGSATSSSSFQVVGNGSTSTISLNCDVIDPFLAKFTKFYSIVAGGTHAGRQSGQHKEATSFTGFTLTLSSGTLTGGTIYVYGYAK